MRYLIALISISLLLLASAICAAALYAANLMGRKADEQLAYRDWEDIEEIDKEFNELCKAERERAGR